MELPQTFGFKAEAVDEEEFRVLALL